MQASNVRAEADARGGRIRLFWTTPRKADLPGFKGVKIVRRENSFPDPEQIRTDPGIHLDTKTKAGEPAVFLDTKLRGETNYYYAVAAYDSSKPPNYFPVYVSAMATTAYASAEHLYEWLPSLYRRYDTLLPPVVAQLDPADLQKGQLRRLVEMFGAEFDLLRSYASAARNFSDVGRVDGALLPLLAQWLGWPTDYSLPFSKQRNEIRYAPHFYRTTGIAPNLRATLNRLTTWDAEIKEFVHNIFNTNNPEQLAAWDMTRRSRAGAWDAPRLATVDVAYEGRLSTVRENRHRHWLFYHSRRRAHRAAADDSQFSAPGDYSHIYFKLWDYDHWLPAQLLTFRDQLCKHPAAVRRKADGNFLVFYTAYTKKDADVYLPQLRLNLVAAGRPARPARIEGTASGPFALAEGDRMKLRVVEGSKAQFKTARFHREDFTDIAQATPAEVARFLDQEMPGIEASVAPGGKILLTSTRQGANVSLKTKWTGAVKLGLPATDAGEDARAAELLSARQQPFQLMHGDTLALKYDGALPFVVVFQRRHFNNIEQATAAEVANVIKSYIPRGASDLQGRVRLVSQTIGAESSIVVDTSESTAAAKLGFGVPPPPAGLAADDTEPTAFEDTNGGIWLFWSSRRDSNKWRILYSRFDGQTWAAPRVLTGGAVGDREPFVLYDASVSDKIWVFWTGRKHDGRKNIFWRTTTELDFAAHTDAVWTQRELTLDSFIEYDNEEPSGVLLDADHAELYFTSNRIEGQQVWSNVVTAAGQQTDARLTEGQFTRRAPSAVRLDEHVTRLVFRTNESQAHDSPSYPATKTTDARNSGSTTIDTRNNPKFGALGRIRDTMHYLYDTARGNENWYSRDTVGIYLTPDTDDAALIIRKRNQIESLLKSFLPIQVRAVVIIQQVFPELVYTYDSPQHPQPRFIGERWYDARLSEVYQGLADNYTDAVNFHWFRIWEAAAGRVDLLIDTEDETPDLSARLFLRNVEEGD